ncbi:hypothetical protein WKK05_06950 [Nostoc sp. UHCC 0302]
MNKFTQPRVFLIPLLLQRHVELELTCFTGCAFRSAIAVGLSFAYRNEVQSLITRTGFNLCFKVENSLITSVC